MARAQRRWGTMAAFALVAAVTQMVWLTFAPVATVAAEHYGVSTSHIGWLAQPFVFFFVILAIPAGLLLDRNFRGWLIVGAVLTALGATVRFVGGTYPWLMVGAILAAIAQPLVLNAVTGMAAQFLPERSRPTGIGVASASIFAGMVLSFVFGVVFSTADQMPTLVGLQALLAVLAAVALIVALRRPAPYRVERPPVGFSAFRAAWGRPLIRLLCAVVFLPFGVFVAVTTWTEVLLDHAGVTAEQSGIILISLVVAGVVGSAILPGWAARRRKEAALLAVAVVVAAGACLTMALVPGFLVGVIAMSALGFFTLAALPVVLELTERESEDAEGTASGLIWMSGNLAGLLIAGIVGFTTGTPVVAYLILAVAALVALPIVRLLRAPIRALAPVSAPGDG